MNSTAGFKQGTFAFLDEPKRYVDGRDELHFSEFPVCSLSSHKRTATNVLVFEDTIIDSGVVTPRKLTVTGNPEKGGLPTSVEDEVLLGLIQLTRISGFVTRTVKFSRGELLNLLGWPTSGHYYKRLEQAFERWKNTDLTYENAWREEDKSDSTWSKKVSFSVIDDYELDTGDSVSHRSAFTWNKHVFKSFESGNLKRLDFNIYNELTLAISRRMFRFLDKRFYQRKTLSFDLLEFAYNKLGISQSYPLGQVKRRLEAPIKELEELQIIKPSSERYRKVGKGKWTITFEKGASKTHTKAVAMLETTKSELHEKLTALGVAEKSAKRIMAEYPDDHIIAKMELLEFHKNDGMEIQSEGGWICNAIEKDFQPPANFRTSQQRAEEARLKAEKRISLRKKKKVEQDKLSAFEKAENEAYDLAENRLKSMTDSEIFKLEEDICVTQPFARNLNKPAFDALKIEWLKEN